MQEATRREPPLEGPFDHDSAKAPEAADLHAAGSMEVEGESGEPSRPDSAGSATDRPTLRQNDDTPAPPPVSAESETGRPTLRQQNDTPIPRPLSTDDEIISAARDAADHLNEGLPNFIVQQNTTRYYSTSRPVQWRALDVVTAEDIYAPSGSKATPAYSGTVWIDKARTMCCL